MSQLEEYNLSQKPQNGRFKVGRVAPGFINRVQFKLINPVSDFKIVPFVVTEYIGPEAGQILEVWHNAGISVEYPREAQLYIDANGFTAGKIEYWLEEYQLRGNGYQFRDTRKSNCCENGLGDYVDTIGEVYLPYSEKIRAGSSGIAPPGAEYARCSSESSLDGAIYLPNTVIPVIIGEQIQVIETGIITYWTRI